MPQEHSFRILLIEQTEDHDEGSVSEADISYEEEVAYRDARRGHTYILPQAYLFFKACCTN